MNYQKLIKIFEDSLSKNPVIVLMGVCLTIQGFYALLNPPLPVKQPEQPIRYVYLKDTTQSQKLANTTLRKGTNKRNIPPHISNELTVYQKELSAIKREAYLEGLDTTNPSFLALFDVLAPPSNPKYIKQSHNGLGLLAQQAREINSRPQMEIIDQPVYSATPNSPKELGRSFRRPSTSETTYVDSSKRNRHIWNYVCSEFSYYNPKLY